MKQKCIFTLPASGAVALVGCLHAPAQDPARCDQLWAVPSMGSLRALHLTADGSAVTQLHSQGAAQCAGAQPFSRSVTTSRSVCRSATSLRVSTHFKVNVRDLNFTGLKAPVV